MPKTKKQPNAKKKRVRAEASLRPVVGDDVYDVWVKMLKKLVPHGRTHRLSVLVASMLAYAACVAESRRDVDEEDPASPLLAACEGMDDDEALGLLKPMLIGLFKDAKVKHQRVSSRGARYNIFEEAVAEFCRWYNYPWEG